MIDFSQMGLGFSISALLICLANIVCIIIQKRTEKPNNRLFLTIMTILAIDAVCGCVSSITYAVRNVYDMPFLVSKSFRYLYFVTHTCLFPVFFVYTLNVCGITLLKKRKKFHTVSIPFLISEILVMLNPFTHWVYTFDTNRVFHRNFGEVFVYIVGAIYYVGSYVIAIRCWRTLSKKRKYILILSYIFAGIGIVIQMLFKQLRVEVLAEAIGFTGILMVVENEDDRQDAVFGIYNRPALRSDLKTIFANKEAKDIFIIKLNDLDAVMRKTGSGRMTILLEEIIRKLKDIFHWYEIYLATPQSLVILTPPSAKNQKLLKMVIELFKRPFEIPGGEAIIDTTILYDELGRHMIKPSDVLYITDTPLLTRSDDPNNKEVDYFIRHLQIEKAVSRGLEQGSFEVYYQPTFTSEGMLHGAEALLRMHDKDLGNIYPDEFIPVAEALGVIDQIDDFVLRRVCEFLKTGIPASGGIEYINVNLSVVECIKDDFIERIEGVLSEFGIEKSCINFEITESATVDDYTTLSRVIHHLKREGFHFSMDDFGTGYSNLQAAFSLGLDIIKIDKSILWAAEQNEIGRTILESNIHMIKKLGKQVLVEGVETPSQIDLLRFLKADYLQGFYFSKPIRKSEFIQIINQNI